jgi:hypothetical protein
MVKHTDPAIKAYLIECDDALQRQVSCSAKGPYKVYLPLPQTPTQVRALNSWLDELYRETAAATRIHLFFQPAT